MLKKSPYLHTSIFLCKDSKIFVPLQYNANMKMLLFDYLVLFVAIQTIHDIILLNYGVHRSSKVF